MLETKQQAVELTELALSRQDVLAAERQQDGALPHQRRVETTQVTHHFLTQLRAPVRHSHRPDVRLTTKQYKVTLVFKACVYVHRNHIAS